MVEECALADASSKHFTPTRYGAATFVNFCHLTTRHTYVVMAIVCASSRHALTPRVCVYVAAYLGYTDQLFVALNAGSDSARALDRSSWLLGLLNFSVMRYVFTDKMDSVAHSLRRLLTIDMIPQVSICVFRQWDPPPPPSPLSPRPHERSHTLPRVGIFCHADRSTDEDCTTTTSFGATGYTSRILLK